MDPTTYCREAIELLREEQGGTLSDPSSFQAIVLLSSYGQQELVPEDFTAALRLLIDRAERSGRPNMAAAARAVLRDWQSRSGSA